MKQFDAEASGRKWLPSWAGRLACTSAAVALALIAAPGAKADVAETFTLMGDVGSILGALTPFTGTVAVDLSDDFAVETSSINTSVQGLPVFNQSASLSLLPSVGVIGAANSAGNSLFLLLAAPQPDMTWADFEPLDFSFGEVVLSGAGVLLGGTGTVTLDAPVTIDPPTATVPELSTWAMMLLGLAGLGLAAKRRRTLAFLGGKA
jgi:MYXO-CTERM domain-containing protein